VDQLREGLSAGLLTVEEFEERVDAAQIVRSTEELHALVAGLPPPRKGKSRQITRGQKAIVSALAFTVVLIAVAIAVSVGVHPHVDTPSTPVSPVNLHVAVMPAGQFSGHDPADQCGAFGTKPVAGNGACYIVVSFTNTSPSAVNFVPADVRMVDQNSHTYSIGPVVPTCYDTIDVNAPTTLQPNADVIVQLCYPVVAGALPQTLQGTHALSGLTQTIPPDSIVSTWGGA
jgi:hypothetical protein